MDSVPEGGNFDGAAGVVAGLLGLVRARLEDAEPKHPVRVIALRGEESAWYGKAGVGSRALFGRLQKADLASVHRDGTGTLGEAMKRNGAAVEAIEAGTPLVDPGDIAGYIELHIEQGPILVADSLPTAVVTSIRGNLRHRRIRCIGEAGHSGAVPRGLRNDPVMATAALIHALDNHWKDWLDRGHDIVVTTGIVETDGRSHSVSRIAGEVAFSFEVRSELIKQLHAQLAEEGITINYPVRTLHFPDGWNPQDGTQLPPRATSIRRPGISHTRSALADDTPGSGDGPEV